MRPLPFFIFLATFAAPFLSAQAQSTIDRYPEEYLHMAEGYAALFNGKVQRPLEGAIESIYLGEHGAVQGAETYAPGDLFHDGVRYSGVKMRLDLYRDELMVSASGNPAYGTLLDPLRLGYADLQGYRVIYEMGGYHVQLYGGTHEVLKKESYSLKEIYSLEGVEREFVARPLRYYISKDGVRHQVKRTRGSVLRLLNEKRGELGRFIRENRLNVRHDTDEALVKIVREYERLTR